MKRSILTTLTFAALLPAGLAFGGPASTVVGFDGGSTGDFTGNAFFEGAGGNPGGNAHFLLTAFGLSLRTGAIGEPANDAFLGDYSPFSSITIGLDVKVDGLTDFIGNPISRPLGISLIDRDIQGPSGSSGIFFLFDNISSAAYGDWTRLEVTIDDPTQIGLPAGWTGFGDEDPNTFEPILPAGASFASVLASVDEFQVTTFQPGFFFNNANWDVRVDNIRLTLVPAPACLALFVPLLAGRRRRRGSVLVDRV